MSVAETIAATEAGIAKADRSVTPEWRAAADQAIAACTTEFVTFTADEVWVKLRAAGVETPKTPSALGPAFRRAAHAGRIRNTHTWKKHSEFSQRHRELLIWESVLVSATS
jgi:hypothetical protein